MHAVFITETGELWGVGDNSSGQYGKEKQLPPIQLGVFPALPFTTEDSGAPRRKKSRVWLTTRSTVGSSTLRSG